MKEEKKVDKMLETLESKGMYKRNKSDSNTAQEQRLSKFDKEENEQDEIVTDIVENIPAKDVKAVGIKDLKQHNDEDNHKVAVAPLIVDGVRHKGIPAKQDVTIERANEIIDARIDEMDSMQVDKKNMFWLIKKKLAEEANFSLNYVDRYSNLSHEILETKKNFKI